VYSDTIKGVGLYEGGPYGQSFLDMEGTKENWKELTKKATTEKTIADTSNIKNSLVMIVSGLNDSAAFPAL